VLIICRSVKGGAGTSVVAAALATMASHSRSTLLVDLAGDQPAIFGCVTPVAGVADWLAAPHAASLMAHAIDIDDHLRIVPTGDAALPHSEATTWSELAEHLRDRSHADTTVIVDLGSNVAPSALIDAADRVLLVVRPCYLTLRRAVALGRLADSVVVLDEESRALRPRDVESVLGLPVVAVVHVRATVARRVDAGILHRRLPDCLVEPLSGLLDEPIRSAS
jgi:MinD-like ATPase involved in chromosome partitioning or flagellar assembly